MTQRPFGVLIEAAEPAWKFLAAESSTELPEALEAIWAARSIFPVSEEIVILP
jgi:hypothetical protein